VGPLEGVTPSRSCQEKKKLDVSLLEYPQRSFWKLQSPGSGLTAKFTSKSLVVGISVVGLTVVGLTVVGLTVVGLTVVGLTVVGLTVVGLTVVGLTVVGFPGLTNIEY